jgi:hypothetical protein
MTQCFQRRQHQRSGSIVIVALVCLVVVMGLAASMIQGAMRDRRHMRTLRDLRQTELLVEAGVDRAAFRLADDADYRGETWDVPAEEIVGRGAGRVVIEASRDGDDKPWQVRVAAEYPLGGETSIRRTRTFTVQPQPPLDEE